MASVRDTGERESGKPIEESLNILQMIAISFFIPTVRNFNFALHDFFFLDMCEYFPKKV